MGGPIGREWITPGDAAREMGVTDHAIRWHISTGRLPVTRWHGRILISSQAWRAFCDNPPVIGRPRKARVDDDKPKRPRGRPRKDAKKK